MAPGPCPAWPVESPCTGAPRPAPTAPPAPTTANPSSPSAADGRPDPRPTSGPGAAARPRTPLGRTRRPPPTRPREGAAREHPQPLGPAAHRLGHPRLGPPGRPRPPPPPHRPLSRPLVLVHPGHRRLPGRDRLRVRPRRPHPRPVATGPADHRPSRDRGRAADHPPQRRPRPPDPGGVRVHGRVRAGRAGRHHRHPPRPLHHRQRRPAGQRHPRPATGAGQDHRQLPGLARRVADLGPHRDQPPRPLLPHHHPQARDVPLDHDAPMSLRFADLNPLGRAIIVVVAALTLAVAAVSFATSYGALYAWARDTGLYSDRLTRIWPLLLDGAFIVAQLAAILAGILRGNRAFPILTMLITGALTVWFNLQHD